MLKGKPFKGARALEVGLIDELVPPAELERANRLLLQPRRDQTAPFVEKLLNLDAVRPFVAEGRSLLETEGKAQSLPGALRHRRSMAALWRLGAESYEAEARSISELMCTPTSRNLVRVFLLQDRLKGLGGKRRSIFGTCTSSAPASWAAISRRGRRFAA